MCALLAPLSRQPGPFRNAIPAQVHKDIWTHGYAHLMCCLGCTSGFTGLRHCMGREKVPSQTSRKGLPHDLVAEARIADASSSSQIRRNPVLPIPSFRKHPNSGSRPGLQSGDMCQAPSPKAVRRRSPRQRPRPRGQRKGSSLVSKDDERDLTTCSHGLGPFVTMMESAHARPVLPN